MDHEPSLKELRGLELELLPGGAVRIGHPRHGKARDDYADAIALAVSEASNCMNTASQLVGAPPEILKIYSGYNL